jgi:hypothetical protein
VGLAYSMNLAVIYFINLRYLESNDALIDYWGAAFAPLPPWSDLSWYYHALVGLLRELEVSPIGAILAGLLFAGTLSFGVRRWQLMSALLAPFLLTLLASAFRKYPFKERLLLFLFPLLFLLITEGVKAVRTTLSRVNRPLAEMVCASVVLYLLYNPAAVAYKNLQHPPLREHIKPVMAYLADKRLRTDLIYVYYGAVPAFSFYMPVFGFDHGDFIIGISSRGEPTRYLEEIAALRGNARVWFVFSHNCSWCIVDEREYILGHLNAIGVKRGEFLSEGASLYLYDLRHLR